MFQLNKAKKRISTNGGSYANLISIREIGSSTKMNSFSGSSNDEDDATLNLRLNICSTLPFSTAKPIVSNLTTEQYIPQSKPSIIIKVINEYEETNDSKLTNHAISAQISLKNASHIEEYINNPRYESLEQYPNMSSNEFEKNNQTALISQNASINYVQNDCADARNISSASLESNDNHSNNCPFIPILSVANAKKPYLSGESFDITNRSMNDRLANRLSLSNIANNPLPSVHGQSMNARNVSANSFCTGETKRTRISTHQRNLSLDFRSMGILLPPVSQVTNTRINLTQHHRNRSLDSALQQIPEVEISSPNADSENMFCSNSIMTASVCNKVVASCSTDPNNTPVAVCDKTDAVINVIHNGSLTNETMKPSNEARIVVVNVSDSNIKKRDDLTSLGSDDSGIICSSEADQTSITRMRRSRESLDSEEIDPEEECIEILETTSKEGDYKALQTNILFYIDDDKQAMNSSHSRSLEQCKIENKSSDRPKFISKRGSQICVPIEYDDNKVSQLQEIHIDQDGLVPKVDALMRNSKLLNKLDECNEHSKPENIKNEVIFKNIFGATKNAIFRTAQSIIENHEKKSVQRINVKTESDEQSQCRSSIELMRKKEFLSLKSSSGKNKLQIPLSLNQTPAEKVFVSPLANTAKNKGKVKVPGVVKCFIKSNKDMEQATISLPKIENGHSGLLRFFESPIFNVHFAIHYLFYSKEPGVLSFIGNKIFSFKDQDCDLYIPQLILMYIQMDDLADSLAPYLIYRCRKGADFSLKCSWLLEAYNYNAESFFQRTADKKTHLSLIKELYPKRERREVRHDKKHTAKDSPMKKTHHRSQSDATGLLNVSLALTPKIFQTPVQLCLGDLSTGRAFDNGCTCFESVRGTVNDLLGHKTVCSCGAPKLAAQREFVKSLIDIGRNLTHLPSKTEKTSILRMRLNLINKNLPARVWLPLNSDIPHHIVRIKEEKTAVLNSKDKTPYIIYVEVVEVNDIYTSPVIPKMMSSLRHTKSEEHLESNTNAPSSSSSSSSSSLSELARMDEKLSILKLCHANSDVSKYWQEKGISDDYAWLPGDDDITSLYFNLNESADCCSASQLSLDSSDSREQNISVPVVFNINDVRTRHSNNLSVENDQRNFGDPEDPSAAALKEPWDEKERQIRESSPYGHLSNWKLLSAIVKCGDDLRQELMATQLLEVFRLIWEEESVDLWVRPYKIVVLSNDSGLIEPILNTVSLHQIKKNSNKSLRDYFIDEYGSTDTESFKRAQKNFMHSCAAYCLISYLLQVKDRHNGNILLHSDGHLIHIDFGFILSISPKNLGFEQSPFKLTPEFVDIMGGLESLLWYEFQHLLLKGLMAARKHMDRIINIVEIMRSGAQLPCFKNGCAGTIRNLRNRFHMNLTEYELEKKLDQLVQDSLNSLSTKLYDGYQYLTNGIL